MTNQHESTSGDRGSLNSLALVSLSASIISYVVFPLLLAVVGIICGFVARSQMKNSGGAQRGKGMALAGVIIGIVGIIWGIVGLIVLESSPFLNVPS